MFGRIFRRFTPKSTRAAVIPINAAVDEKVNEALPAGDGFERPDEDAAAAAAAATAPSGTSRVLLEEVKWRTEALQEGLSNSMRSTDAPAVLSALGSECETMLRQPPAAARRALVVSRDPLADVTDMVRLIEQDPGLAQSLLRQANSSYYGGRGTCTSLSDSVQRVGMRGVENVILASMVSGMLCRPGGAYGPLVEQVWSHMVRSAPIGRQIAPAFGVDPEQAYALTLLHDAGKLVLFDRVAELRVRWRRELRMSQNVLLGAVRVLHESLGGLAVLDWGLGESAAWAIATHHRTLPTEAEDTASSVIYLAERLDLAELRNEAVDLEGWWSSGHLAGDMERVRGILGSTEEQAA